MGLFCWKGGFGGAYSTLLLGACRESGASLFQGRTAGAQERKTEMRGSAWVSGGVFTCKDSPAAGQVTWEVSILKRFPSLEVSRSQNSPGQLGLILCLSRRLN